MNTEKRIVDSIFLLKRRCMFKIEDLSAEAGLVPREMAAIESLEPGERVSGNELSRRMELSPSRGSRIIERLIRKGYLVRETDPGDRRAVLISLSERGGEQKRKIDSLKDDCERLLRSKLEGEQLDRVREGMEILLKVV
jgi:DNA-binding MarR family transcriptional regulator